MFRRTAFIAVTLVVVFVAGLILVSVNSGKSIAQQTQTEKGAFGQNSNSPFAQNQTFGAVQKTNQPVGLQGETFSLARTTYLLPRDSAKTLTELFAHKATSLVECRTESTDESTPEGLVKFVVTAEPNTQDAIKRFVQVVFPQDNLRQFVATETDNASAQAKRLNSRLQVSLNLPSMTCGGCASSVKKYLATKEFVKEVAVDVRNRTAIFSVSANTEVETFLARAKDENRFFKDAKHLKLAE